MVISHPSRNSITPLPVDFLAADHSGCSRLLPRTVQCRVEAFFGIDVSDLRTLISRQAATLGAKAFTDGNDIYFAPNHFDFRSPEVLRLLGHELTHVLQARSGRLNHPTDDSVLLCDIALEAEAECLADLFVDSLHLPLRSHAKPKLLPRRANGVIQCALAQHPTMVTSRAALGDPNDAGVTSPPASFTTPHFSINCQQRHDGWYASLQVHRHADEGTNTSRYLGVGLYSTDLMFMGGARTNYVPGPNNRRIYVEISSAIADLNRQAELEHCNDIIRAYNLTLVAAQNALTNALGGNPYGPFLKRPKAMQAIRQAIIAGLHARLQKIFRDAINVDSNVNIQKFSSDLSQLYLNIANITQQRDGQGWHTFLPDNSGESWSGRSWAEYGGRKLLPETTRSRLFGEQKDIRKLVQGPHFNVPGTPSAILIHL